MKRIPPALILLVTIAAVAVATWLFSRPPQQATPQSPPPTVTATSEPTPSVATTASSTTDVNDYKGEGWDGTSPEPTPTIASNVPTETADHDQMADPEGVDKLALELAGQFVDGWGDPSDNRETKLKDITHPALYDSLTAIPLNRRITAAPAGEPIITELSSSRVIVEQALVDRPAIWILLTDDPTAPHGWYVVAVEPKPES